MKVFREFLIYRFTNACIFKRDLCKKPARLDKNVSKKKYAALKVKYVHDVVQGGIVILESK